MRLSKLRIMGLSPNLLLRIIFIIGLMLCRSASAEEWKISSGFGWRTHPITGERHFHTGVDFPLDYGTGIPALKSGKVIYAARWGGYGNCIILQHPDGDKTLYAHCSSFIAQYDDEVIRGEVIARVGSTGISTGPHLHIEWWHNGIYCNPIHLLERR